MATVRLSDVVVPAVYSTLDPVNSPEKTVFVESGIVSRNALLDALASGPSNVYNLPFWNDLDASGEPNYSTDNPADIATPDKIGMGSQMARNAYMNKAFSSMDLTAEISGRNPMQQIRNRFGTYWARQFQHRMIAVAVGVMNANVAQNGGDMTNNISISTGTVAGANLFSRQAFTTAAFNLGDRADEIEAIAVHSIIMKRMVDNGDIDFIPDQTGNLTVPTYLGKRVIQDDGMPVANPNAGIFQYTSILFGRGAFAYGDGEPNVAEEMFRLPSSGNGGGEDQIWERKTWLIHPFGYDFTNNTVLGQSATLANLRLAANWARKVPRKVVPISFLVTNG